ncbi:DUF4136 domain-containing protein [Novosphingobium mangrovi (ex Huang et al. 2023)]|uniref:DUF4136 domain-containing protein n=1 Tax=Novosphingobium mangrovi (ex Huang et al. 2023) TaxID=2976432 RepID=A0ABT2IA10_9SPHN|nr:DUF4136 domain-containing protein [Novosphingobium mangrovi (ex Huang et al. 2023)]MCT2401665.1 DUF4136 domain-containing protein [Novosphingobium mangrovi (ex Huang et al. 2023)]
MTRTLTARLRGKVIAPLTLAAALALSGCVAPVGPVEITRFHAADIAALGQGTIRVEPAQGQMENMEFRTYAMAVSRELTRVGYVEPLPGESGSRQVALLRLERQRYQPQRESGPVSVGVGGSTGSYGSGVGVGIGIDLSGPPPEQVATKLSVIIIDRASGKHLWEGRASFVVRADSPMAQTSLGAAKMTEALFKGFPGESGETILVK